MYQLYTNPKNEKEVIILERYESRDALKLHGQSDAFKAFGRALKKEGIGSVASVDVYNEVGNSGFIGRSKL